ncbi:MAG: hypothetical protein ACOYIG_04245 [Acetivibrionales bacterium]
MKIYGYIGVTCLFLAVLLVFLNFVYSKKQKKVSGSLRQEGEKIFALYVSLYNKISRIPVLNKVLHSIRKRLEIYTVSDEKNIRKTTVTLFISSATAYASVVFIFWAITRDLLLLILFTVLLSFIGDTIIELFINNLQNKLLRQQIKYLELLRHKYYEQKSVEDANMEACNLLNNEGTYEVYAQAERINDILSSRDVEEELGKYYETAPNKYFKMLAGIIYITKEYGDTIAKGGSVFIRCITYLGREIKAELYKREKLKYALRSLSTISLLPLFFLKPLRTWASESFAPLKSFYTGKLGIVLGIVTILTSIISYIILRRLQSFDSNISSGYVKKSLEARLYEKFLHPIVDRLVPREYTKQSYYFSELIKNAMAPVNIYTLYVRRLLVGFLTFLLGIFMFLGLNEYSRYSILYLPQMPEGYLGGQLSDQEYAMLKNITDFDRSIILSLGKNPSEEMVLEELLQNGQLDNKEREIAHKRIYRKIEKLSNNIFWWWQLIICFLLFTAGYWAPVLALQIMVKARKIDMEDEVSQFQTIILMLMHMNRVHVQEILEWMETFSIQFKEPLQKCILNFSSGPHEALEELKAEVGFSPFLTIIDNLQLAISDLDVAKAFEELEDEMNFNRETRKESNERIVEKKKNLGNMLGFLPVYALILLYLIIPMLVTGMNSISVFYKQIRNL